MTRYKLPAKILLLYVPAFTVLIIAACNVIIVMSTRNQLYHEVKDIPAQKTAIVLGTSSKLRGGTPNPYFHYRISAAAQLYHKGKIDYLILSGDNRTRYYNEPLQMRKEMLKYNVPDSVLYLDYAGLRTLDSMIRSNKVFGQDSIIVVSQKFHNQRAIFIANIHGIHATGFNATNVDNRQGIRTQFREVFARVKVFIDIITRKQPRHLGDSITIGQE